MDFLPPQCGSASHRRTVAPSHRAPRTVAPPQWVQPDLRHSVVARHRHRAPLHCANTSYFLEYNAVLVIVCIPSSLPLYDGVAPVACFAK